MYFQVLIAIIIVIVSYFKWAFTYWKRKGVPYLEPGIPFGTSENPATRKVFIGTRLATQYQKLKAQGHKHGGLFMFTSPTYLLVDPEYIKNVMSRDFSHFMDHGGGHDEKHDPLSANLFHLTGQKWKNLRAKLTPTFTSGKMKMMFQTLTACGDQLVAAVEEFAGKKLAVDIKDVLSRFTTDVIGSCAFGLDCNSFKEPQSDFRKFGELLFKTPGKLQAIKNVIVLASPKLAAFLGIYNSDPSVKEFFLDVVKETVRYREETDTERKDFLQILIELKNDPNGDGLTIEQVTAQALVFFAAGFETSSTTMSFALYEFAKNPDIQKRAREEIQTVLSKHEGKVTYEAIMEMKFLNQVLEETLRKYSPASVLPRVCVEEYQVPDTNVTIEKGTRVIIPAHALHHDPDYFPDPEKFDPERFNDENKKLIRPYTYLPFGEGPRICIGQRFAMLEMKVGLSALLKNFRFAVSPKTQEPLVFDPFNFMIKVKGGVWLDIEKVY